MSPRTSHTEFAPTPDAPARARHHLRTLAVTWQIPPSVLESAELALSELITNALQHATTTPTIGLTIRQTDHTLRLEVTDASPAPPRLTDPRALPAPDAETGRGLLIIAAVAKQWGYAHRLTGGKSVWCELTTD